jgi:exopolyphosphatase/guanosine-5'-triphosphate,3'-diphosphate pyrophosphatase
METDQKLVDFKQLQSLVAPGDAHHDAQRLAIVDMGSNTFRLIVVEYMPNLSFKIVDEVQESVRLSEGMAGDDVLRPEAMDRAVRAAQIYASFCRASGITDIITVGTSAVREAHNRAYFLKRIQSEARLPVRVLSGEEEAYYAYLAAVNSTTLENGFVIDLGGGSLEIIRVENRRNTQMRSFQLGAVRVTESFLHADPPSAKDVHRLQKHVREQLGDLEWFRCDSPNTMVVGEGGTLRLLGRLAQKRIGYPMDSLHGYTVSREDVEAVRDELARMSVTQRKRIAGMKPERADISLGGALVVAETLRAAGAESMTICSQGVREGLFYERFLNGATGDQGTPLFADVRQASVLNLAHLYRFQEKHAEQIARLTLSMFDQLPPEMHQCGPVERELLWAASMLHDIGVSVDYHDHHKHSAYLVMNAGLPGYTHREIAFIALLVRYHRKGRPSTDEFAALLQDGDDRRLAQLTALLRLAEQLDRSRDGVVTNIRLEAAPGRVVMETVFHGDEQVALWAVDRHREIFEQAFGARLLIVPIPDDMS